MRNLIGVNSGGLRPIETPHMPAMSVRGFIKPANGNATALLEIKELNRSFLVEVGTEIPVMVTGRVTPVGQAELTGLAGLAGQGKPPPAPVAADSQEQSQIILKVTKVTKEGVTIQTNVLSQSLIIR